MTSLEARAKAPFFVVGSPRSGTTLMKSILDGHPHLAIPEESHFIVGLGQKQSLLFGGGKVSVEDIVTNSRFATWEMDPQIVRDHVAEVAPRSYPELVAATFAAYARWRNKERWGDKTPGYATYMPYLQRMFPNALFVHMIRDGREVAASLPEHKWGPRTAVGGAYWWRTKVRKARRDGARLKPGTYLEVRLDELIERPEVTVSLVCEFLAEPYEAEMLDYPDRYKGKEMDRGTRHLMKPPTAGLREWRRGLTKLDQRAVEAVCRPLLRELGYDAAPFDPVAGAYARLQRIRELIVSAPTAVSMRLRPSTRSY